MRKIINIDKGWTFDDANGNNPVTVDIPHTWNNLDGCTGGDNYLRARHRYAKTVNLEQGKTVYLEVKGANSSATITVNGEVVATHHGGFSTFRADISRFASDETKIEIEVDNIKNENVYPQTADFTFFGGLYRDVNLIIVDKTHFNPDFGGSEGLKVTPELVDGQWQVRLDCSVIGEGKVKYVIVDKDKIVAESDENTITITEPHLWNGLSDPYMYTAKAVLYANGHVIDEITAPFGLRTFRIDSDEGFFLNGRKYPLRGVCRHQDRKGKGYALTKADHEEDMQLIREIGANTVRLAHYQHDDYFYDLCDRAGMIVWAEIPYISRHMPDANDNTESQIVELINQQYNHPSIVVWGISNEITMFGKHKKDMLAQHVKLNDLCHKLDKTRLTTLACFSMCTPGNKVAHITDVVSWNLYLGWYVPFFWLNDLWFRYFRKHYPRRPIGLSEYGAEGMTNLHSLKPKRGDNTEEYQCLYHEYMLKFFARNDYLWATHVWNMFDFAADARNQGGEPGMNHKGLVTYDRKTKKDAFYLYKAYWSNDPFVHICGRRFVNRTGNKLAVKVYSNLPEVTLSVNGKVVGTQKCDKVTVFTLPMSAENTVVVTAGNLSDQIFVRKVAKKDKSYLLTKTNTKNWQK